MVTLGPPGQSRVISPSRDLVQSYLQNSFWHTRQHSRTLQGLGPGHRLGAVTQPSTFIQEICFSFALFGTRVESRGLTFKCSR